jgi:hypothetical protein
MVEKNAAHIMEKLYTTLAYTSAVAVLITGCTFIVLAMQREIVCATWQIILGCMAVPLLAAIAWSCGNYRENARVRLIAGIAFLPVGLINPLMWLCVLVIFLRRALSAPDHPVRAIRSSPLPHLHHVHPVRQLVEIRVEDRD